MTENDLIMYFGMAVMIVIIVVAYALLGDKDEIDGKSKKDD